MGLARDWLIRTYWHLLALAICCEVLPRVFIDKLDSMILTKIHVAMSRMNRGAAADNVLLL